MSSTHIQKRSTVLLQVCLSVWLFLSITGQAAAGNSFTTTTISFYAGFDLTSGMTEIDPTVLTLIIGDGQEIEAIAAPQIDPLFEFSPEIDLYFGFSANAERPFSVIAEQIKGMTVLEDTEFDAVTENMLKALDIPAVTEVVIDQDDLVVLLTQDDQYVLLGSVQQLPGVQVQFTYQTMSGGSGGEPGEVPEPSTLLLLGVGLAGLLGCLKRTQQHHKFTGGTRMKLFKTLFLMLMIGLLSVETGVAAKLTIIKIGTGKGMVEGEDVFCGPFCEKNYEEKTVVHLKAIPDHDSRFVGWLVNGEPTEGVVTIDQDDLVVAAKFEMNTLSDDLIIHWYNGPHQERAIMVLDEVAVFLENWENWGVSTQDEVSAVVREITQRFHPHATISAQFENYLILVKSPEPLEEETFPQVLTNLTALNAVKQVSPVFYVVPEDPTTQLILTDEINVKFPNHYTEDQIGAIEAEYGLTRTRSLSYISNGFVYTVSAPLEALSTANQLYESGRVEYAYPEWLKHYVLWNQLPTDPYFNDQWHLRNTGQHGGTAGEDANVTSVWKTHKGTGIAIAIVDDGVEIHHEDLAQNVRCDLNYDFVDGDDDPSPSPSAFAMDPYGGHLPLERQLKARHGTAVAGVAAGKCFNDHGICGAAPEADLVGFRKMLFGTTNYGIQIIPRVPQLIGKPGTNADALLQHYDKIHIYNNSWGSLTLSKLSENEHNALMQGTQYGRHRLGSIYVFGAGNLGRYYLNGEDVSDGLNSNYTAFANSRYTIAVGASGHDGSSTYYSAPGANIVINAPSSGITLSGRPYGISTTDRTGEEGYNPWGDNSWHLLPYEDYPDVNYTKNFGGTSSAAPLVSGIIALMLEANPDLTWRDVQHILMTTARKNDPKDPDWTENAAGYPINHKYGFGCINAAAAVHAASSWTQETIPDELKDPERPIGWNREAVSIPDLDLTGISKKISIEQNMRIEFIEVYLTAEHTRWGDLEVVLTSPDSSGRTKSVLAEEHHSFTGLLKYDDWRFGTVRHFGEPSKGDWFLTIKDKKSGETGTFKYWAIKIYGTALPTWTLTTPTASTCEQAEGGGVVCTFADGSGSVLLQPTNVERPDLRYVFLAADDAESATHNGTYWFPTPADDESTYGINLNITMDVNPAWLPLPADQQTTQTVSAPVCSAMSPPEPLDVQKTLRWTLSAAAQEHACTLSLTWEDAEKPGQPLTTPLTLTFQDPTGACQPQLLAPATGTVDVLARYPWEEQDTTYLASIWDFQVVGTHTTIKNPTSFVPRISQEESWYWGPASACGDYPLCPVCARDMYLQGRFQPPVPTVPYPPERPVEVRPTPQYPAASMTWMTYAKVLGSSTYWTDASGGCAQLRSCANRVAPYTTVYECTTETTGYRAITTTYNLTWESTPDHHGPCERTYVQATVPNIVAPSSEFLASVSVTTR